MKIVKQAISFILIAFLLFFGWRGFFYLAKKFEENRILKQVVQRLSADSRIAEVLVTSSRYHETTHKIETTIKFLEYDAKGKPLLPRYFTFEGNLIQFQALVIRFDDKLVQAGDQLKGKSAYIFLRAFMLDEKNTQVFDIARVHEIPKGYKIGRAS